MLLSTVKASLPVVHIVPPSAILIRNHLKCVEHAVNYRVQPVQRMSLQLHHEDDMSLGEIAEELGVSRQAVHDNLQRARHILNESCKDMRCLSVNNGP